MIKVEDCKIDKRKPVVIVDDDEVILSVLQVILGKIGFTDIRTAVDGQKALVVIMNIVPCLLITDIDMPVMNGLQLVHQIRKKRRFEKMPVIALTANDTKEMVIKALKTGVDSYLIKGEIRESDVRGKINDAEQYRLNKLLS
jgi:PleD family two-component response regulator